jgi:hypothetical protein
VPANPKLALAQTQKNQTPNRPLVDERHHRTGTRTRSSKLTMRRQAELLAASRAEIRSASAISKWESPTIALLRSPGDKVLTTLPQLNETVNELKLFLPGRSN